MNIENRILELVKKTNPKLEIAGLRGLVKTNENEWSFRYTFMDDDYLSISDLFKVKLEGLKKLPVFINKKQETIKVVNKKKKFAKK